MGTKKRNPPPSFATKKGSWDRNHYVIMFDDLLNSPAYINLSSAAKETYTILLQEYKGPANGSKVICPYATFEKKGMRANTLSNAILMLEVFGFIEVDHGGLEHRPSIYKFSDGWKKINTADDVNEAKEALKEVKEHKRKAKQR